ncbi:NF038120 family PEP-CTERM protein [Roseateles sp. DC23W]|uniref:NF038120 family PEP-CTERM protein n=1 Tax=Pelomonas dachongensis TaxID=3299029 RepID=A0ABW7EL47_9BURK
MQKYLIKGALALASAAICGSVWAAPATIAIGFENPANAGSVYFGGDTFTDTGFKFSAVDPNGAGFVGATINGLAPADSSACSLSICPSASSSYYGVLNDGSVRMERGDGGSFRLAGFDAGFIAEFLDGSLFGPGLGQLIVNGGTGAGMMTETFVLDGLLNDGTTAFAHFDFSSAFSDMAFTEVSFTACLWDAGSCTAGASFNLAKFGLDNIAVIPEPGSYALVGLGLLAAAGARRRRNV